MLAEPGRAGKMPGPPRLLLASHKMPQPISVHGKTAPPLDQSDVWPDLRSWASMGLLGAGVAVLLVAVVSRSWSFIIFALALTGGLGWVGDHLGGV